MQVKTIETVIKKELNAWLETIADVRLRERVRKNLLLSGGSITSMFFHEDVNDFDIYLQDEKVLLDLANYYAKSLESDQYEVLSLLLPSNEKKVEENAYSIAVSSLIPGQVKLFFCQDCDKGGIAINQNREVTENMETHVPLFFSPNAISLSDRIQIVTRFTGDCTQIHKTFDFTHATNYFTFKEGLVVNNKALVSLLTKQLRYQGSMYPLTSIIRMKKFIKRGWNISAGEILKIMFQIAEFDLKDPQVLEDQLIGVDVAYFSTLIEILRGADPSKITSSYLNEVIDKVFNSSKEDY